MNSLFWFFFQRPTALAKIVGAFRIGFRNNQTNNDLKQDLLVMENLFYNCSISQVRFVIVLNESSMRLWMIIYFIYSFQEKKTEYWRFFFFSRLLISRAQWGIGWSTRPKFAGPSRSLFCWTKIFSSVRVSITIYLSVLTIFFLFNIHLHDGFRAICKSKHFEFTSFLLCVKKK